MPPKSPSAGKATARAPSAPKRKNSNASSLPKDAMGSKTASRTSVRSAEKDRDKKPKTPSDTISEGRDSVVEREARLEEERERERRMEEEREKEREREQKEAEDRERRIKEDEIKSYERRVESLPVRVEVLKRGLKNLGRTETGRQVFCKLALPNTGISSINFLQNYPYLQTLELPGNGIEDITPLSSLRYLQQLDLSSNKLTYFSIDPPPYNLQEVDLSRNCIGDMEGLRGHRFLMKVCLDRNLIKKISGIEECRYLTHLSLVNNGISKLKGLDNVPLKFLDVRYNHITILQGLETLTNLEELHISHNSIASLMPLYKTTSLRLLNIDNNEIPTIESLSPLQTLPLLRDVNLQNNPLTTSPTYRPQTIFALQNLTVLDCIPVNAEEKVAAVNLYDPPPSVVASVQHAGFLKRFGGVEFAGGADGIRRVELVRRWRLRPVVLCGSKGVGKRTLAIRLVTTHPDIFALVPTHTTRAPYPDETVTATYPYIHISRAEMQDLIDAGAFLEVVVLFGEIYGIAVESLDAVTKDGKVGVMCMELDGVLALKRTHLAPHYIFITAPDMDELRNRLEDTFSRGHISQNEDSETTEPLPRPQTTPLPSNLSPPPFEPTVSSPSLPYVPHEPSAIDLWLAKAKLLPIYIESDTCFDHKIVNDDLDKAYEDLERFCMEEWDRGLEVED